MDNKNDLTENLIKAMKLFSEKTKRIFDEINYDALLKSENVLADYMKSYNASANLIFLDPKKSEKSYVTNCGDFSHQLCGIRFDK